MLRFFNKVMVEVWWEIKAKSEREKLYKNRTSAGLRFRGNEELWEQGTHRWGHHSTGTLTTQ